MLVNRQSPFFDLERVRALFEANKEWLEGADLSRIADSDWLFAVYDAGKFRGACWVTDEGGLPFYHGVSERGAAKAMERAQRELLALMFEHWDAAYTRTSFRHAVLFNLRCGMERLDGCQFRMEKEKWQRPPERG